MGSPNSPVLQQANGNLYPTLDYASGSLVLETVLACLPKEAERIKAECLKIVDRYNNEKFVKEQFDLLKEKKLRVNDTDLSQGSYDATNAFMDVFNSYNDALANYNRLKNLAIKAGVFTREGVEAIEDAAFYNCQDFFPEYQELFLQKKNKIQTETKQTLDEVDQKIKEINSNYDKRYKSYIMFHIIAGLFTIAFPLVVGVLLAGIVVHFVDMLTSTIRLHAQEAKARKAVKEQPNKIDALNKKMHEDLKCANTKDVLKQNIFNLPWKNKQLNQIHQAIGRPLPREYDNKVFSELNILDLPENLRADYLLAEAKRIQEKALLLCKQRIEQIRRNDESFGAEFGLLNDFQKLKEQAVAAGFCSAQEAENIEQAAIKSSQEFFPLYQELFNKKAQVIHDNTNQYLQKKMDEASVMGDRFIARELGYVMGMFFTGYLSIPFPVAFPFFLAEVGMAVLDPIICGAVLLVDEIGKIFAKKKDAKQIEDLRQQFKEDISKDSQLNYKQNFFNLNKTLQKGNKEVIAVRNYAPVVLAH